MLNEETEVRNKRYINSIISNNDINNNNAQQDKDNMIKLAQKVERLKDENKTLLNRIEQHQCSSNIQFDESNYILRSEYIEKITQLERNYEDSLSQVKAIHQQEKSILIDKLEAKSSFAFGDQYKRNAEHELKSNTTMKEEIDKLNFMIEEKDYMNIELKEQIVSLRDKLTKFQSGTFECKSHDDWSKQILSLVKENARLQKDLNKTEENYNEQCLFYKQKINDERQRNIDIKEEITDLRNMYEKKVNNYTNQLLEREQELNKIKREIKELGLSKSSIFKSTKENNWVDSTVIYDNNRSFTPNSCSFVQERTTKFSSSFNQDEGLRSSQLTIDQRLMQNANRVEWKQCLNLLNLTSFYGHLKNDGTCMMMKNISFENSVEGSFLSPNRRSLIYQNLQDLNVIPSQSSEYNITNTSKNEFAYGEVHSQNRLSLISTNHKSSAPNILLNSNDSCSKQMNNRSKPKILNVSHSLQNSARK